MDAWEDIPMRTALATAAAWLLLTLVPQSATADTIDFESGFLSGDPLGAVVTPTNTVTFSVGPGAPTGPAFAADMGGVHTAFTASGLPADTPFGGVGGAFFLSDDDGPPFDAFDFFFEFDVPVADLALVIYDFRGAGDGGAPTGATATLTVFSDPFFTTAVGSGVFVAPGLVAPDGNVGAVSVLAPTGLVRSASLVFSHPDVGMGIDDIAFTTVPEPGTAALFLLGLAGVGLRRRRRT